MGKRRNGGTVIMAIQKVIPKDIRKYEPKLIGPFTTRQVLCFTPAAILSVAIFMGFSKILPIDIRFALVTIVAAPFILFGVCKPYNMPLEKFLKTVFVSTVLAPKYRKYRTPKIDILPYENSVDNSHYTSKNKRKKAKKKNLDPSFQPYQ